MCSRVVVASCSRRLPLRRLSPRCTLFTRFARASLAAVAVCLNGMEKKKKKLNLKILLRATDGRKGLKSVKCASPLVHCNGENVI